MRNLFIGWLLVRLAMHLIGDLDANKHIPIEERKANISKFFDVAIIETFAKHMTILCYVMDIATILYAMKNLR